MNEQILWLSGIVDRLGNFIVLAGRLRLDGFLGIGGLFAILTGVAHNKRYDYMLDQ